MTVPGEVTLDEMKLLLERAHKGEIIPLYVFLREDNQPWEYWRRRLDKKSRLSRTADRIDYSSEKGNPRNTGSGPNLGAYHFFTNYWMAYAYTLKRSGRAPVAVNID